MDAIVLPAAAYCSDSPQARRHTLNTIIEDEPQITSRYIALRSPTRTSVLSPVYSEDFPTPRAIQHDVPTRVNSQPEFDELYDVTDDEAEEVPLKCSSSVSSKYGKNTQRPSIRSSKTYPSVIIPSPSAWPTIEKLQKSVTLSLSPMPPQLASPAPQALSMLAARSLQVPNSSATPSLDGSMTSDEMSNLSCPSTPDVAQPREEEEWDGTIQLHPQAMQTLHRLSADDKETQLDQAPEAPAGEMKELDSSVRQASGVNLIVTPVGDGPNDPLSALSIPSPGGFFSSLGENARHTWCTSPAEMPSTSTAESFYNLPWRRRSSEAVEQVIEVKRLTDENLTDGPPTARRIIPVPSEVEEITEFKITDSDFEYNEDYDNELRQSSSANIDRTGLWLSSQESYLATLRETNLMDEPKTPSSRAHSSESSLREIIASPTKSVRFADEVFGSPSKSSPEASSPKLSPKPAKKPAQKLSTFVEGFQHVRENSHKSDAFVHRRARAEALRLDLQCLTRSHCDQLLGKFELKDPHRPSPIRPISHFFYEDGPSEQKEMIDKAQKERQALDQIKPVSWNLEATKMLNGGGLLTSPCGKAFSRINGGTVLDLGGQASCDWAWEVALQYPRSKVYTISTTDQPTSTTLEGPENHNYRVVPNLWTLPFPNSHFDIISARSLHALLKTHKPTDKAMDEYDLCLRECIRCLKPGGFLEFALLDADIVHAGNLASAASVEFNFCLRTRGYDPQPTKSFLARLRKAGFGDIKRAWLVLPMAQTGKAVDGSTVDASFITGIVGAWAWEKWMLKLHMEMGKDEGKLLDGVAAVLEEGAQSGAAWRYLSGWARKPVAK